MAKLGGILVLFWYAFLSILPAFSASLNYCTNNSKVATQTKPEGNIVFPSTTLNYTGELCYAEIRSSLNSKTRLTLVNLIRQKRPFEQCHGSLEILQASSLPINYRRYCKSVGSREVITLNTTVTMVYRASFRNELGEDKSEDAISVHYKRLEATKACRYGRVLTAPSGEFGTSDHDGVMQKECEWVINTGGGEGISLKFDIMNEQYLNCENNFIEIRQGESADAPKLRKICHHSDLRPFKTSSTKLWIHVKSSTTNSIQFRATYKTDICKVIVVNKPLDFQSFFSPSCQTWNLTAPMGHIAALSFSDINLVSTHSTSCTGNVLEVWDGVTKTSYCNLNLPPSLIVSKGRKLVVTYRSNEIYSSSFQASFTSIFPSSYRTNCFVMDRELSFKCFNSQQVIPCLWQCDGAMQCTDNSDESNCSDMEERWHKLQVFVIVIGSICASTVIFCIGLICFRKCIVHNGSTSSTRLSRNLSVVDHSLLTPNADLPSPPPGYFTDQNEEPPASVIRGTYFFGDEFSQSGIHNASLFGIPPPRYRSTESLHRSNSESRSIWQRGISSIPLVPTDTSGSTEIPIPEENPPDYESLSVDKDEQIVIATQNNDSTDNAACSQGDPESLSGECVLNDAGTHPETSAMELQVHTPITTSHSREVVADTCDSSIGIGMVNSGATLNV